MNDPLLFNNLGKFILRKHPHFLNLMTCVTADAKGY